MISEINFAQNQIHPEHDLAATLEQGGTAPMSYPEIHRALRNKMLWEKARLLQSGDLPDPTEVYNWSLKLEILRRNERAQEAGDLRGLRSLLKTARGIVG